METLERVFPGADYREHTPDEKTEVPASHRFVVETEFKRDKRTIIYSGDDYQKAAKITNFWDERQNTWLVQRPMDALSVANRKFDTLAAKVAG